MSPRLARLLLICLLCAGGAALRLHQLGTTPPGLYHDEAYYALDAAGVLQGHHALYFPANNGREPIFIYLIALSLSVFGHTPFAVRLPAAFIGILLLPASYLLGRALFNRRVGILTLAITASTFWAIALSRVGFRVGTLPLFTALWLAAAAWGWRQQQLKWVILGGVLYGLSFYTYLAARLTPLPLSAFAIFWYIARRSTFPPGRWLLAFFLPAALVVAPFGLLALTQPALFAGRTEQVSILNPGINHGDFWGTLFNNTWATLGMFFWHGDTIARHNLPGRPVFDPALALAFAVGCALALRGVWQRRLALTLVGLWVGALLLPTLFAEDTPHFLRAAGILPVVFILPALALEKLSHFGRWAWAAPIILALSLVASGSAYFGQYAQDPNTAYLFESAATQLAQQINRAAANGEQVYVDGRYRTQFTSVEFLVGPNPHIVWFTTGAALTPTTGTATSIFVWPYEDPQATLGVVPPGSVVTPTVGPLHRGDLEPAPYALYTQYTAQPACPALCGPPLATFANGLRLQTGHIVSTPTGWAAQLVWAAASPPGRDWQVFAQALGPVGVPVASADGPLGTAAYPSRWWPAPVWVAETRVFAPEVSAVVGPLTFQVGLYDLATGARVPRTDEPSDTVLLAP